MEIIYWESSKGSSWMTMMILLRRPPRLASGTPMTGLRNGSECLAGDRDEVGIYRR